MKRKQEIEQHGGSESTADNIGYKVPSRICNADKMELC